MSSSPTDPTPRPGSSEPMDDEGPPPGPPFSARPATTGMILACTLAFVGTLIGLGIRSEEPVSALLDSSWRIKDVELLTNAGALAAARVWLDGEWWRVASAGLLHGSWLHLGLNMLGLWSVGQWTEKVWGGWRQLVLAAVSSVGGCLASLAWVEAPLVVGASAGIFGIAGALVVARAWGSDEIREALEPVSAGTLAFWLIFWLAIGALLPLFDVPLFAQAGHIGGLVFGCLVGFGFSRPKEQRFLRVGSGVLVAAGLACVAFASLAPAWRPNYRVFVGGELLRRDDFPGALEQFEHAVVADPDNHELANGVAYSLAEAGVELERAERLVAEALEAEPGNSDYLDTLGWIRCKQGRAGEGAVALRMAGAFAELAKRETPEIAEHLEACESVAVPRGTP